MNEINASIITIGDELLIGQTIDTNSAFIGQELNKIGIWAKRRVAVGDVYEDIWHALDEESTQSQLIIITGGLGPTADDITKPLLCNYFGGRLVQDNKVLAHIEHLFTNVYLGKGPLTDANRKQAEVPDNCTVLHNERGSAPGMWFEKTGAAGKKRIFISMPGVPHEMKKIFTDEALPKIMSAFSGTTVVHKTAVTFGIGETSIATLLTAFEQKLPEYMKLAYLPGFGMVKLRLTARGSNRESLKEEVDVLYQEMKNILQQVIISDKDASLEAIVAELLLNQNKTLATAESCTGGYIAHLITSMPGSSNYFKGAVVAYANETKQHVLNVNEETLSTEGAVSESTVQQMVKGVIKELKTDYAIATSGIMGPNGGTPEKPVGTVWIAAGNRHHIITKQLHLRFDRERNIKTTALQALNLLRMFILDNSAEA